MKSAAIPARLGLNLRQHGRPFAAWLLAGRRRGFVAGVSLQRHRHQEQGATGDDGSRRDPPARLREIGKPRAIARGDAAGGPAQRSRIVFDVLNLAAHGLGPIRSRAGQPHELAAMGLFLASDDASYVNGQAIPVDGGLTASMPYAGKPV